MATLAESGGRTTRSTATSRNGRIPRTLEAARSFRTYHSEDRGLFGGGFGCVLKSRAKLAQLLPGFLGANVYPATFGVMIANVIAMRNALKIISPIVGFVFVFMVNIVCWVVIVQPASRHDTMHEPASAQDHIAILSRGRFMWLKLPENLAATRDSEKMVKTTVLDTVHREAFHGAFLSVASYHPRKGNVK